MVSPSSPDSPGNGLYGGSTEPLLAVDNHSEHGDSVVIRRRHHHGRILDRDADFFQSRGRWNGVQLLPRESGRRNRSSLQQGNIAHPSRRGASSCAQCWKRRMRRSFPRLMDDWFHTLAYQRTILLMMILFCVYFAIVVAFGFLYLAVSVLGAKKTYKSDGSFVTESFCDMDINDHMEALYFSLSTMTTIGYGVSDYYFGGCWIPLLLVLMQVCTAITFDACAVGLLFTRLSRGRKRSKTIIVSNQAIVQRVQGIPYFMFRVGELRRFPLIQASVRLYCIRHERIPKWYHVGDYNASHATATERIPVASRSTVTKATADTRNNSSSSSPLTTIPVETTHFVTRAMKMLHNSDESSNDSNYILMSLPQVIVHRMDETSPLTPPCEWYDTNGKHHVYPANPDNLLDTQHQVQEFWKDRGVEIVVLLEGTDELTGAVIQTRHSYSTSCDEEDGDVVWNRAFVNCILPYHDSDLMNDEEVAAPEEPCIGPVCTVDFSKFHDTFQVPRDCLMSPYVPF